MKVQVSVNNVKIIEPSILNENEYNIHECEFEFVEEYNGLSKKAIFTNEAGADYIVSIVNDKCSIPSEVLKEKEFVKLGVYAYDVENEELVLRYSPKPTEFYVQEGSYKNAGGTPPTPSEIEQLQAQITHNRNDIEEIQDNINDINEQQAIQDETIQNNTNAIGIINETIGTINENIGDLQEGQVVQNRNIQANSDNIEDIQQEQITQNTNIQKNTDDIVEINQNINEIDGHINAINQNIDNLEQDLTNYSLITETGSQINLNVNSTNYQITAILKDKNGNVIYTSNAIDLPIESMIVNARYDNTTKEIVLTLQNGNTLRISVADLISGLVSETQLQTILANYYNKTEIDNLLSNLAERVSTNEEDIADIKEEQTTQNEDIEELQNKVEELETENENLRKALPQIKGEGTDITLENTSKNKFVEFGLGGGTEQEQLSGKNLLDGANPTGANFATATMIGNIIKVSSTTTNTTPSVRYEFNNVQQGNTYRINAIIKNSNGQIVLQTKQNDSWTTYTILSYNNGTSISAYSYVIGTNVNAIRYLLYADKSIPTGATESSYENVIVTKNNTDMTYEPYCGGIPAPNSNYIEPIKNVTGNANVKIQNKNLFDGEIELGSINPANGELQVNAGRTRSKNFIKVKPNTTYTISVQTGQFRWIVGYNARKVGITDGNVSGQASALSSFFVPTYLTTNTFTTTATTEYIKWYDTSSTDLTEKVQIEEGSTATSYVPHQEQNYPFTFAEGQFLADDGKLQENGIYNELQKIIFDGTENVLPYEVGDDYDGFAIKIKNTYLRNAGDRTSQKYNYFIELGHSPAYGRQPNKATMGTDGYLYVFFEKNVMANTTAVQTWLANNYANNKPLIAIGKVQNPTPIPYNSTQQAQYDAIKQATSEDDITIISSESDELGFDMKVIAVADANKVIENQNNEIDTIKSRLDLLEG